MSKQSIAVNRALAFLSTLIDDEPWTMRDAERVALDLQAAFPDKKRKPKQRKAGDITDGWRLHKCDDGTYDAYREENGTEFGYDYHNLGNGRTELSAWVDLREKLCERR